LLAEKQVVIECTLTTDNPTIEAAGGRVLHGGNFQAMAYLSDGKGPCFHAGYWLHAFSQRIELINPRLNNGLPPNLTADEPSQSFIMKGVDVGRRCTPIVSYI